MVEGMKLLPLERSGEYWNLGTKSCKAMTRRKVMGGKAWNFLEPVSPGLGLGVSLNAGRDGR